MATTKGKEVVMAHFSDIKVKSSGHYRRHTLDPKDPRKYVLPRMGKPVDREASLRTIQERGSK